MGDVVIGCEDLGKRYRLDHAGGRTGHGSLRASAGRTLERLAGKRGERAVPDTFWALRNVSFEVCRGEVVGIVGRNGAGKSTLLKILARITEPTTGRAMIRGRVASLLEVGTGFHPELTGRENIHLNGAILGMRREEVRRKLDAIVAFAEVERFLDLPVKRYSSGMAVRLAFAVAAHLEPEILLVDEVLAVGDAQFQAKCLGRMSTMAARGRTVLFVSHNAQALRALCNRTIWLDDHELAMDGSPDQVLARYLRQPGIGDIAGTISRLPEDPLFRLHDVALTQRGASIAGDIEASQPLEIRIVYEIRKPVLGLRVLFQLCDALDTVIVESFHDEGAATLAEVQPGRYASTAIMPAHLVATIPYRLKIRAGIHHGRPVMPLDGLVVDLVGRTPLCGPPEYAGLANQARVAPPIAWRTERHA